MNLLFVNYGDFTTNSLNHIGGFANTLSAAGHACAVAVPTDLETLRHVADPLFIPVTHAEATARPALFPDGRPADLIHVWTPRESVRKCALAYQRAVVAAGGTPARLVIHLEDNEHFLLERYTGRTLAQLRALPAGELAGLIDDRLPHPFRAESFLRLADAVTHIIAPLAEFAPPGTPTHLLLPGVDFGLYRADLAGSAAATAERATLGLAPDERVLVFTGSNTFANEPEMRELYLAVALLNQRGVPTRLVRTGLNSPRFLAGLPEDVRRHVLDLGFVEKRRLPVLLALADVLVQPGQPGPFNDYRLPSKLPEFLASGRPVVMPRTNLASLLEDGRDALFLPSGGTPEDIADACQRLFRDPDLAATLGRHGAAFARSHFDLGGNTRALAALYAETVARPGRADWTALAEPTATDATLFAAGLAAQLNEAAATLDDPAARQLAAQTDLLAGLVRQLEQGVEAAARDRVAAALGDRNAVLAREELTRNHARNLEGLLAAAREHATGLERARELTQNHADHVARERDQHRVRREQADVLLRTARLQVTAYENAILAADAELAELRPALANTRAELAETRDRAAREAAAQAEAARLAEAELRARHAAELAAAAQRLTQAQDVLRTREDKISRMQESLSWRATAPFRALRRALFDGPAAPVASSVLLGNVD